MKKDLLKRLLKAAEVHYGKKDPSHDWEHIERVLKLARHIAKKEKADEEVVCAAALFHDCVKLRVKRGKDNSSQLSAVRAGKILKNIAGFPAGKIPAVQQAIYEHTFSLGIRPKSLESQVVQDADRLDSMGAIGIMRIFAYTGAHEGALFSTRDPFCQTQRTPDPYSFGLDWVPARMARLPGRINTRTGRQLARTRAATLRRWLAGLRSELKQLGR